LETNLNKMKCSKRCAPIAVAIFTLSVLIFAPFFLSFYGLSLLIQTLIFGLFAMSLDILIGYAGLVSFNHATFFGIAAYTVGILSVNNYQNFWVNTLAGIIIAMLLAALLGLLVLRSSGPYFLLITLAFGQLIFALAWKWRSLTGGDDGLPGIQRPEIGLPISMWDDKNFYYLLLVFFIISAVFLWWFVRSPMGKAITGMRESESRMQALGYNTWLLKYLSYIITAGFAALAGILYVYYNGFISPQELSWTASGLVILMVIIGGAESLVGPVVGAGVILILQNLISAYTERWPLFLGTIFVLCVMYARNGIVGYLLKLWNRGRKEDECIRS
jgi:branched-chain amino acid transport system permease protein